MAIIDFGGTKEEVVMRSEFPMEKARQVLKDETVAIIGYGVQGPAQSLNLKDNGFKVIIGQSKQFMQDWDRAVKDGWKPGVDLFEINEAVKRGTVIEMLVSDAAQRLIQPEVKKNLKPGDALYFSHGFSIVFKDQTKVNRKLDSARFREWYGLDVLQLLGDRPAGRLGLETQVQEGCHAGI